MLHSLPQALVFPSAVHHVVTTALLTNLVNTRKAPLATRLRQAQSLVLPMSQFQNYEWSDTYDDEDAVRYFCWQVGYRRLLKKGTPLKTLMEVAGITEFAIAWHKADQNVWVSFEENSNVITLHRRSRRQEVTIESKHGPRPCGLSRAKTSQSRRMMPRRSRCLCFATGNIDGTEYWVSYVMLDVWPAKLRRGGQMIWS